MNAISMTIPSENIGVLLLHFRSGRPLFFFFFPFGRGQRFLRERNERIEGKVGQYIVQAEFGGAK
jgi:hypothetical protein